MKNKYFPDEDIDMDDLYFIIRISMRQISIR